MKVLLTGANGYIGKRLLTHLTKAGHEVIAVVRDTDRITISDASASQVTKVSADFLESETLNNLPKEFDVAYYLIHSLSSTTGDFSEMESKAAENFANYISTTTAQQIVYLGGISNDDELSKHLESRKNVEHILQAAKVPVTVLRAAIIIGSGGASFEIIRDLVEKLPLMIAPKWLNTKCQPIGIRNVIQYLEKVALNEAVYHKTYDIGGPDVLTYRQMLLEFAKVRGIKRYILTVPLFSPKISSYWLYFVTSTSYQLAVNLVESMKNEVVVKDDLNQVISIPLFSYSDAVKLAFNRIEQNMVVSSWVDSDSFINHDAALNEFIEVPQNGTFKDIKYYEFLKERQAQVKSNIWTIGGSKGWYYGNFLWKLRGYMDKLVGGVGLRRGRRSPTDINPGDSLDFWRVLLADEKQVRLLLFAEMKLPGDAWLEFKINPHKTDENKLVLVQTATFRPTGVAGRLYWYAVLPFHGFIFTNMAKRVAFYD
ncbi:SDR family oxidoreductase [Vicingaceae bacterium]|nr:SDR family oxidoreductase [Vicingaceae bacterium]